MSEAKVNETHGASLESWVGSANELDHDFPIQNLPFGVFKASTGAPRVGVAIGDCVLDIAAASSLRLFEGAAKDAAARCEAETLNSLMQAGSNHWRSLRAALSRLLRSDTEEGARAQKDRDKILLPMADVEMVLPAEIGDFTDFYASVFHAQNVGRLFRPDNPLLPNYKYVPVAYHGRASSVLVSGTDFHIPFGQRKPPTQEIPSFEPSKGMDFEAEIGIFVGPGNTLGEPIPLARASEHVFGLCLLHDWSARDIQAWEYQPLGPFLAKNFASHVSPWVVSLDALAPFRVGAYERPEDDPAPLPHLNDAQDQENGGLDIQIEVFLSTQRMRQTSEEPFRLSQSRFRELYWTVFQMVAHHTSNGCNLRSGDLLGSGTVSSSAPGAYGSLIEHTKRGAEMLSLPSGEERAFLQEGDEVTLRAYCQRDGYRRIGFGECRAMLKPARS